MSPQGEEPPDPTAKEKILAKINERVKSAQEAQDAATKARQRAEETSDAEEKQSAIEEAVKNEKKAVSEMKAVQRLQSGVWQGGAGGAGIGAGVGMGLGTVVGSLVGGVAAIPTTSLGLLAGMGTGAIHGPWVKLGMGDKKEDEEIVTEERDSEA
ncbi:hypothetical protein BP6252_03934 [Coleophoma cylindrospora]|uniref:Uncharacterized protein n=1 Tax=Coleophoma cylindrospora TaxID=1849047 RepID=A0A3D8S8Z7_9HELO|nr:hypothetical protein BP6252_03934 [Coleophoma cylindrospora]